MTALVTEEGGGEQSAAEQDRKEHAANRADDHGRPRQALVSENEQRARDHDHADQDDPADHAEEIGPRLGHAVRIAWWDRHQPELLARIEGPAADLDPFAWRGNRDLASLGAS